MVDLEQLTMEEFNTLYAQNNHNFSKTIAVIRAEGSKTRATERAEGSKTRNSVHGEAQLTRGLVNAAIEETQFQGALTRVNDNINNYKTNEHISSEAKAIKEQQQELANQIMTKLNSMPNKESIAKDILKGQLKLPVEILKKGVQGLVTLPVNILESILKALQ